VWNAASGQLLTKLEGHTGNVKDANFSPDGQRVVTASEDRCVDLQRRKITRLRNLLHFSTSTRLRQAPVSGRFSWRN